MRRSIIRWIAVTLGILGISLLLTSLFSGNYNSYRTALGESLVWLGLTLLLRMRWPGSGQIDGALVVSMLLFILPRWLVDMVARWPIRWRLVAHVALGNVASPVAHLCRRSDLWRLTRRSYSGGSRRRSQFVTHAVCDDDTSASG